MRDWSSLVHFLAQRLPEDPKVLRDFLNALWPQVVGEVLGLRTRVASVAGATLVVGVPSWIWQRELRGLQSMILFRLEKALGRRMITQLSFALEPGLEPGTHKGKKEEPKGKPFTLPDLPLDDIQNPALRELLEQTAASYLARQERS